MSNSAMTGSAPQGPVSHREQRSSLIEFFRHHGAWAPGVKLFRRMGFKSKAMVICAVFIVPILTLGWNFFKANADAIAFSAKERLGVEYARELMPLLALAHQQRNVSVGVAPSGSDTSGIQSRVDAQLKKLASVDARIGEELGTTKLHTDLGQAAAALVPGATGESAYAAHTRFVDALLALLGQSTDGSNLTLDPDIDSYYVMDAALFRNPQMIDLADRMRGTGSAVLAAGSGKPEQMAVIYDAAPVFGYHLDNLKSGLAKSIAYNGDVATPLNEKQAVEKMNEFITLVRSSLLATSGPKGDRAALIGAADAAIAAQFALSERMLGTLDALIVKRVGGMESQRNIAAAVVLVALLTAVYLFYSFFLVTHGGLREVQRHLEAMTAGDLTTSPRPWGKDEAAHLMGSLSDMQKSLRNIVARVRGSSESLVHASSEIASASMDLSSRTEQTAANLEESASSMEEISSTVKNTSENSIQASRVAEGNAQTAARGGSVIGQVVSTMQDINASSQRISEIIGTIDGIAFQTNILALNAAVEAARAGEQGRGFAVVASEVRSLAQRSAQAAKEIKTLITTSVERVESGTRIVQGAGATMSELVANAERMRSLLAEISTAASEQSDGVTQVGAAVQDLDKMTQQNAALVEQTAAAASSLRDQALDLANEVSRFKLPAHG
jgi:methyl-accepting chemotaxis protein